MGAVERQTAASDSATRADCDPERGVTKLAVIDESEIAVDSVTLDSGQTSATVYLPPKKNATVVAI